MRIAALDLGSNTFLLLIAEVENHQVVKIIRDECRVIRLGEAVDKTRIFSPAALHRAQNCLQEFSETISELKVDRIQAVATSAARDVKNQSELLAIGSRYGINISIITGEEEARLSFLGGVSGLDFSEDVRVIDVGGGSTEFIFWNGQKIQSAYSLDIGSVRLTERFISRHPVSQSELQNLEWFVQSQLKRLPAKISGASGPLIAVAGTPTTLVSVILGEEEFDGDKIHGFRLSLAVMKEWYVQLARMTVDERAALNGMEPLRADVIVAGVAILIEALEYLGLKELTVSVRGVRYGLALEGANEVRGISIS